MIFRQHFALNTLKASTFLACVLALAQLEVVKPGKGSMPLKGLGPPYSVQRLDPDLLPKTKVPKAISCL